MSRIRSGNTLPEKTGVVPFIGWFFALQSMVQKTSFSQGDQILFSSATKRWFSFTALSGIGTGLREYTNAEDAPGLLGAEVWRNVRRDRANRRKLRRAGWKVIVLWECEIGQASTLTSHLGRIIPNRGVGATSLPFGGNAVPPILRRVFGEL
jgi:DNA mismatch endonuclease (patch repair protein)